MCPRPKKIDRSALDLKHFAIVNVVVVVVAAAALYFWLAVLRQVAIVDLVIVLRR